LRAMADGEHRLARPHERLDEAHGLVVRSQLVRAAAARDEQGVEVVRPHVLERPVGPGLDLALVTLELRAGLGAHDRYLVPRLSERVKRFFELRVLESGTENTGDSHATPPDFEFQTPRYEVNQ